MPDRGADAGVVGRAAARVVFFGYGELAITGLDTLATAGAHLVATVVPANRSGAEVDLVRDWAKRRSVPVVVQPRRRDVGPFVEMLQQIAPDVIVVWSYSMILPPQVLAIPRLGAVNVHGGLLPAYRGGHVGQWAIINGERESGVTLHYMDEGIDTGPIVAQQRFPLDEEDDAHVLRARIRAAGATLLAQWWPSLADGSAPRAAQDESRARHWPMRTPEQGAVAWSANAVDITRLVRALRCNTPGAYVDVAGRRLSIREVAVHRPLVSGAAPGRVVNVDDTGVRVATADGDVVIRAAEIDGDPAALSAVAALLTGCRAGL